MRTPHRLASIYHHLHPHTPPSGSTLSAHHELAISQTYQTDLTKKLTIPYQTYFAGLTAGRTHMKLQLHGRTRFAGLTWAKLAIPWPNSLCRIHMGQTYYSMAELTVSGLTQAELTGPSQSVWTNFKWTRKQRNSTKNRSVV